MSPAVGAIQLLWVTKVCGSQLHPKRNAEVGDISQGIHNCSKVGLSRKLGDCGSDGKYEDLTFT